MSVDRKTLRVYGQKADDYAALTRSATSDPALVTFIGALPRGAHVLDLGCGPGQAAAEMVRAGLTADAVDASPAMVELAAQHDGVNAWSAAFDDLTGSDIYDGIWANFSLLHAPRGDMPGHLRTLRELLKPGGLFHIGMKIGSGERRDDFGRLYTYYTETELSALLREAGLVPFSSATGSDIGLDGQMADWVTIAAHG